jgi:hypothetical protein
MRIAVDIADHWVTYNSADPIEAIRQAEVCHEEAGWDSLMKTWPSAHPLHQVDNATMARQCASLGVANLRTAVMPVHVRWGLIDLNRHGNPTCTVVAWGMDGNRAPHAWMKYGTMRTTKDLGDHTCWVIDHTCVILTALGETEEIALSKAARDGCVMACARKPHWPQYEYTQTRNPTARAIEEAFLPTIEAAERLHERLTGGRSYVSPHEKLSPLAATVHHGATDGHRVRASTTKVAHRNSDRQTRVHRWAAARDAATDLITQYVHRRLSELSQHQVAFVGDSVRRRWSNVE